MYDMYPEWGPAHLREDYDEQSPQPLQAGVELRDNGGQRPDDN